jgi:hypothetical protein
MLRRTVGNLHGRHLQKMNGMVQLQGARTGNALAEMFDELVKLVVWYHIGPAKGADYEETRP